MCLVQPAFKKHFAHVARAVIEGLSIDLDFEINATIQGGMSGSAFSYRMVPSAGYGRPADLIVPQILADYTEQATSFLLMALFRELQGVDRSGFKTCPQCGGYFVLASETAQVYCSKRCSDAKRGADYRARQKKGGTDDSDG